MRLASLARRTFAAAPPKAVCQGPPLLTGVLVALLPLLAITIGGCGDDDERISSSAAATTTVRQVNLVADVAGQAAMTDPNLVNAWGIAHGPSTAFWIADNGQGVSTVYDGAGRPFPIAQPLVVTIPPPAGSPADSTAAPTGMVFNDSADFAITDGGHSGPSAFIFATEDGTLSGWNQNVNVAAAILAADNSADGAVYKGLALASNGASNLLFATNFHAGRIDVFDKNFAAGTLTGSFTDPNIPAGFAPFGIANLAGNLYVTYAKQNDEKHDDVSALGNGFVDIFDTSGNLVRRFASGGTLNSPWGLVRTPSGFGGLGNTILVGNFGDGRINIFDPNGGFMGQLTDGHAPITIDGLWGLIFGNGGNAGDANTLFFTAGPNEEKHGLFGALQVTGGGM